MGRSPREYCALLSGIEFLFPCLKRHTNKNLVALLQHSSLQCRLDTGQNLDSPPIPPNFHDTVNATGHRNCSPPHRRLGYYSCCHACTNLCAYPISLGQEYTWALPSSTSSVLRASGDQHCNRLRHLGSTSPNHQVFAATQTTKDHPHVHFRPRLFVSYLQLL
jgi:hypothetical protein